MAPPACDFPEYYDRSEKGKVKTRKEIKSHPGTGSCTRVNSQPGGDDEVVKPAVEKHAEDTPLVSPSLANAPVPEPPMHAPKCIRYMESSFCDAAVAAPTPPDSCCGGTPLLEDSLGLEYGLILGIFVLGALTGSSIVYAFSKPVVVYAAN